MIGLLNRAHSWLAQLPSAQRRGRDLPPVDHLIWQRLWQWAKHRHPKSSRQWVKDQYFPALGRRAWTFAVDTGRRTPEGQPFWVKLVYASETKIQRHIQIRKDGNPLDSQWQPHLQERAFYKKFGIHRREAGIKPS